MKKWAQIVEELPLTIKEHTTEQFWLHLLDDSLGNSLAIPVIIKKGREGPIVCIAAAIHGDELNGLSVIHKLQSAVEELHGTIIYIPVVNIPGYLRGQRHFLDGKDLNMIMPGSKSGKISAMYVNAFIEKVLKKCSVLLDLHTARSGTSNCFYIRANMNDSILRKMALDGQSSLILHSVPTKTTIRGVASRLGIHAITLELGDPLRYQKSIVEDGTKGIIHILRGLGVLKGKYSTLKKLPPTCYSSDRFVSRKAGIIEVYPALRQQIEKGDHIATLRNVFGKTIQEFTAPEGGIVIGKKTNPVTQPGDYFLHIGKHDQSKNITHKRK